MDIKSTLALKGRVEALCSEYGGVSVIWEQEHHPRTSMKAVYLGNPKHIQPKDRLQYEAGVYHECMHHSKRGLKGMRLLKKNMDVLKKKKVLKDVWNLFEDCSIESNFRGRYLGIDSVMDSGRAEEFTNLKPMTITDPRWRALWGMVIAHYESVYPSCKGLSSKFLGTIPKDIVDKIGDVSKYSCVGKSAEDTFSNAQVLTELLFEDEEGKEKGDEKGEDGEQGDEGNTDSGNERKEDEGKEEDSSQGEDSEGEEDNDRKGISKGVILDEENDEEHKELVSRDADNKYTGDEGENFPAHPTRDMERVKDWNNYVGKHKEMLDLVVRNQVNSKYSSHAGLGKKLRAYFKVKSRTQTQYNKERGKVGRGLHKLCVKGVKPTIFKQKHQELSTAVDVAVLLDCSGSMFDEKYIEASTSFLMINDALQSIGVNYALYGFTEKDNRYDPHTILYHFKDWSVRVLKNNLLLDRLTNIQMANNADGEALHLVWNDLSTQKNKRKMVIVLSDGDPRSRRGWGIYNYTKWIIKGMEADGIEMYGVGIQSDCSEFYKNNQTVNNTEELETALLNLLKKVI